MYAIVEAGGKQYRVAQGDKIRVEKCNAEVGDTLKLDKVVMIGKDDGPVFGMPHVSGANVTAKVLEHGKEKKVIVFRYRRKKNYRRFHGHKQQYTDLSVESINV